MNDNWLPGTTCDVPHQNRWYGTVCHSGGIYSLELRANNLLGALPTQLGALPELESLRLESNPLLSGTIPTEIGGLQKLRILDLGNNTLSGSLPQEMRYLGQLWYLDISTNTISGTLPSRSQWPSLGHANLATNAISGSLSEAVTSSGLRDVGYLSMHTNFFSGTLPTEVALLTSLRDRVYFHSNRLIGTLPTQLGAMTHVPLPALYHNSIEGFLPSELGNLPMLVFPAVSYNRISGTTPTEMLGSPWRGIDARLDIASNIMRDHCERWHCQHDKPLDWRGTSVEQRRLVEQAGIDRDIIHRQLNLPIPITWWDSWSRCTSRQNPGATPNPRQCSVSAWNYAPARRDSELYESEY